MSLKLFGSVVLASAALVPGCVTPTAAAATTTTATPPAPDPEVVMLRERVARLERRIVDVDSKLALLVARGDTAAPLTGGGARPRPLRFDMPRGEQQPIDLEDSASGRQASIDIERGARAADVVADVPLPVDDSDDGGSVTIRMNGDSRPTVDVSADDDPLAALSSASDLYAWGQARLKEGRHQEAIAAFEDVLGRFPSHDLADNAMYWIGWAHQQKGDHRLAIAAWQKLPARFPKSAKVADGLFGMAQSHEALGEPAVAEALYDEVVSSYPKAEKLKDAKRALSRLRPR
jgi:tol-pal system protein YbgF